MKLGQTGGRLVALDPDTQQWKWIGAPWNDDLLAFLANGADGRALATTAFRHAPVMAAPSGLPFEPRSLRAYALWQAHMEHAAQQLARRFLPPGLAGLVKAYEAMTGKVFPLLRVPRRFHEVPGFYVGNHRAFRGDGEALPWPLRTRYLDFELELGFVLAQRVRDCTPEQGAAAIGGYFVVNDWSVRDVQFEDTRHNTFGGVVKPKTCLNSMSAVVITPDEFAGLESLTGRVRVNGEVWVEGSGAGAAHTLGAMVAYAADSEDLGPGDCFATGTLPGCCGAELDRYIAPGDEVTLELDGIGRLSNRVGSRAAESPGQP